MVETQEPDIPGACAAVKAILEALNVTRVVCVDDTYEDQASIEEIVVAASGLEAATLSDVLPELGNVPEDEDVLKDQLRHLWPQLDDAIRIDRADKILAAARLTDTTGTDDDAGDASIFNELIPDGMLFTLSPRQWEDRRETLIEQDREQRTLFLFDQDLSGNGGDEQGGIKIIAALLARNDTARIICGLLTHTITPEVQLRRWMELSEAYNIPLDRFLVVPKQYLRKDPVVFAQNLKLLALSPDFVELKDKTKKLIEQASASAAESVEDINIYDLDYMVFQVSGLEGIWEPDMLFRLHALYHRLESRRLAHEGGELETIASRLRAVSQIPTQTKTVPESSTWAIQRKELYEPAEYLNGNHLPLEVGDIFERTDTESKKRYILLAQPCDLMVRSDGKRSPEIARVPVAEVIRRPEPPKQSSEMAYFGSSPNERWYVNLKQVHHVRICVLDLCVFNEDGSAKIQPDATVLDKIRPAWKARYRILSKVFRKRVTRIGLLSQAENESAAITTLKQKLRTELTGDLLNEEPFKGSLVEINGQAGIAYNCRRISRLFGARAYGLLMDYTSSVGRMAYDRDFVQAPHS